LPALLIPVFSILVYAHTLHFPFHFDGQGLIENNTEIRDLYDPLRVIISNDPGHRNRPLLMLSLGLNYHFSGNNVFGYHVFNILLHTLSSVLLYAICLLLWRHSPNGASPRLAQTRALAGGIILLAVLFYTVQPMNTEAITYISGRSSSMSTFFLLLAFFLYLKSRLRGMEDALSRRVLYSAGALLSYCLSIASKEIGVVLPALLLAGDYYFFFTRADKTKSQIPCFS